MSRIPRSFEKTWVDPWSVNSITKIHVGGEGGGSDLHLTQRAAVQMMEFCSDSVAGFKLFGGL